MRGPEYRHLKREILCRGAIAAARAGKRTLIVSATAKDAKAVRDRIIELAGIMPLEITVQDISEEPPC